MISTENTGQKTFLIKKVIKSLQSRKSESFEAELCYPGFLVWNRFLAESYKRENVNNLDPLINFHVYDGNWVQKISSDYIEFQKLWETARIRSIRRDCKWNFCFRSPRGPTWEKKTGSLKQSVNKSFAIATYQKNNEKIHNFPNNFSVTKKSKNSQLYIMDVVSFLWVCINKVLVKT